MGSPSCPSYCFCCGSISSRGRSPVAGLPESHPGALFIPLCPHRHRYIGFGKGSRGRAGTAPLHLPHLLPALQKPYLVWRTPDYHILWPGTGSTSLPLHGKDSQQGEILVPLYSQRPGLEPYSPLPSYTIATNDRPHARYNGFIAEEQIYLHAFLPLP